MNFFMLKWNTLLVKIILDISGKQFCMLGQYILLFSNCIKRQNALPFTKVGQRDSTIMCIVLNKAGLNFDIPRNNVPIVRKVTYLLRKGG